jgi:hypothetical protein
LKEWNVEFFLVNTDQFDYTGKLVSSVFYLDNFSEYPKIKVNSLDELISIPFNNPKLFTLFLKNNNWSEKDLKILTGAEGYIVNGKKFSLKGWDE